MPSRLVLQFLGLPQIHLDGRPISSDRRKAIALLAYLAVNDIGHPRRKYSREVLSALLWPDYEQAKAFSNLRTIIWEIRQAIGEGWLLADRGSVQLNAEAEIDLDIGCFQDLLSQSRKENDPAFRIPLLSDSAKLYRDHFLTGFNLKDAPNFNEWAFAESEELRRKLVEALTMLSEDHCALGQAEQAISYARRLVAFDPLNEAAHRLLMQVYFQAGQHSAALKQYQTCEQILRKELNLDPQPETRELYKKILKGEIKPIRTEMRATPITPRDNLPLQLSSFVGREKELNDIAKLIGKSRLVTLTGVGGIGKTRLSLEAARKIFSDFPDGMWFIELAPLSDPAFVPQAVVNALGLIEQAGRLPVSILTDFLRVKRTLLILDNCEHLIQACAQLAETLLHNCPDLHILATSREALEIAGETLYLVPPLMIPDSAHVALESLSDYEAVQLFVERAQSALAGFMFTQDNAPSIAQICHQLDGIPLALELAAARMKVLRVEEIAARLHDSFRLLTGGARTALPRHQTLRAMIDWSYDLLSEPERVLLRRLSVFAGGWTLEAAESVCVDVGQDDTSYSKSILPNDVLDLLTSLVNKSLIIVKREQGKETRYRMLETIRQYALEKLWTASEGDVNRQRHLAYFVDLAERAEPNLRAFDMVMWLDRLEAEHDNIRAALEWAQESDVEAQLRLASALLWFWHIRGRRNEGIDWLERGLSIEVTERGGQLLTPARSLIRGNALNASGALMTMFFDYEKARARLEESLGLFQEIGPAGARGMAYALWGLVSSVGSAPPPPSVGNQEMSLLEQSLTLFREVGDKFGIAQCLLSLAGSREMEDDYKQAIIVAEEQLAVRKEIGDQDGIATALGNLRDLVFKEGDYQKAIVFHEESLAIFRKLGNKWAIGYGLSQFGDIFLYQGDYPEATKIYEEALAFAHDVSDRFLIAYNSYSLGGIAYLRGDYARATQLVTDSLGVFREVGNAWMVAGTLHTLGDIALAQGDEARATQWYEAELTLIQESQIKPSLLFVFCGLGKVAWVKGAYELGTKRFEEVLRMSRGTNLKLATFQALYGLGRVAQSQSDYVTARAMYAEALEIQGLGTEHLFEWVSLKACLAAHKYLPLGALAAISTAKNHMEQAAKLFSAIEPLYHLIKFQQPPAERAEHDQAIATARAALGEESFIAAWEEGQKMTLDEAVALALEE